MGVPNPSGDPRLDPAFMRKHGRERPGYEKAIPGRAQVTKLYNVGEGIFIKTRALSQFLIVGRINGKGVILFRATKLARATEIINNQKRVDEWRWMRVIDQKTREVLWMKPGERELRRWEGK